ncbi:MAG TPA: thioredoxin domain-containing protein [Candidatus Xenobia bacterium]|nr:thioredoxin domain-containing protein [Candidatus Xenobia bacterium]
MNRLVGSRSPFLRHGATQPVAWWPFCDEAFREAREQDRPVLLDIGAVWCHWCHVMDRESYEDAETAQIINQHFVPIKVDRDERPDIDARYQAAVSAISGQGGWPLTAFLTPDGKPFFGGTYFPPDDTFGRPGFKRVLAAIAANYVTRLAEIRASADNLVEALRQAEMFAGAKRAFDPRVIDSIADSAVRMFDFRFGGFGGAPKFPHSTAIELILERYQSTGERALLTVVTTTLDAMARGGVYDQVGGGFHRYSVDERWHVPHFEKMSYDNSELLKNYLHAWQVTGNALYRRIAEGIISWVNTTLSDPQGGFYASQDADYSLEDDGDYFTWTLEEVRAALPADDAELVIEHFDVRQHGPMHHNAAKNVLHVALPAEELARNRAVPVDEIEKRLDAAKAMMLETRKQRPTPYVDKTVYVAWNGMFISAYLEAARVLGREDCRQLAMGTLDRILESAWSDEWGFAHRCPEAGQRVGSEWAGGVLDDQVFMAMALLDAFETTGEKRYFEAAERTIKICLEKFWDEGGGGFFDRPKDAPAIAEGVDVPRKAFQDSPTPAGNPIAAMALDRLASYAMNQTYRQRAEQTLEAFAGVAEQYGLFAATYGLAALLHVRHPLEVVIVGKGDDARTRELERAANAAFRFGKAVLRYDPQGTSAHQLPPGLAATLPALGDGAPRALVCVNGSCRPPVTQAEELTAAITGAAQ